MLVDARTLKVGDVIELGHKDFRTLTSVGDARMAGRTFFVWRWKKASLSSGKTDCGFAGVAPGSNVQVFRAEVAALDAAVR